MNTLDMNLQEAIASNFRNNWLDQSSEIACWPSQRLIAHPVSACCGNCTFHPLMRPEYRLSLADQADLYEAERNAYETDADRAARAAALNAERAARELDSEAIRRECYARDVKERATMGLRRGEAPRKVVQPCKWVIGQFQGDECWAWEYTDPKTKKRCCPHTCTRLHPGQAGWHNEWYKNRYFQPPEAVAAAKPTPAAKPVAPARFAALSGRPAQPAQPAQKTKTPAKGKWGALEESDEEISAW